MTNYLLMFINEFWSVLTEMSPYLLFGFLMAAVISLFLSPAVAQRHLGGSGFGSIFKASLFGVPLPLCSCGVIPVATSLRQKGASRGATASFLLSTPQTGVDSILVSYSLLGPFFAIYRPVVAFLTGLIGGVAVSRFGEKDAGGAGAPSHGAPSCESSSGCAPAGERKSGARGWRRRVADAAHHGLVALPRDIARPLLLGVVIAAGISMAAPDSLFRGPLGEGLSGMLLMMLFGIPLYVCATASTPIAAALIAKGVSPGVALVFLMTGPATNAATISTIWKILGPRTAILYLLTVIVTALGAGAAVDQIFRPSGGWMAPHLHTMLPEWLGAACAIGLLALLASASGDAPGRLRGLLAKKGNGMKTIRLRVRGMSCNHCAAAVQRALLQCAGVAAARITLATGVAEIEGGAMETAALLRAVREAGYQAEPADDGVK